MSHPPDRTPDEAGDPDSSAASSSPAPRGSDAADDLLATAEDLAGSGEAGWRSRSSTVRRPRRVVRGSPASGLLDDTEEPQRVRVRSSAEEVGGGGRTGTSEGSNNAEDATDPPMLDASGQVIRPPAADEQAVVDSLHDPTSGGTDDRSFSRTEVAASREAAVLDASVFLVDAARSYLAGVDEYGSEHEVTRDRRDRLRRTIELWDRQ